MKLLKISLCVIAILKLTAPCYSQNYGVRRPDSITTALYDIILRPSLYNGKIVLTSGYISTKFEGWFITPNIDVTTIYDPTIQVDYTLSEDLKKEMSESILKKLEGSYVTVEGRMEVLHDANPKYPGMSTKTINLTRIYVLKYAPIKGTE